MSPYLGIVASAAAIGAEGTDPGDAVPVDSLLVSDMDELEPEDAPFGVLLSGAAQGTGGDFLALSGDAV